MSIHNNADIAEVPDRQIFESFIETSINQYMHDVLRAIKSSRGIWELLASLTLFKNKTQALINSSKNYQAEYTDFINIHLKSAFKRIQHAIEIKMESNAGDYGTVFKIGEEIRHILS